MHPFSTRHEFTLRGCAHPSDVASPGRAQAKVATRALDATEELIFPRSCDEREAFVV